MGRYEEFFFCNQILIVMTAHRNMVWEESVWQVEVFAHWRKVCLYWGWFEYVFFLRWMFTSSSGTKMKRPIRSCSWILTLMMTMSRTSGVARRTSPRIHRPRHLLLIWREHIAKLTPATKLWYSPNRFRINGTWCYYFIPGHWFCFALTPRLKSHLTCKLCMILCFISTILKHMIIWFSRDLFRARCWVPSSFRPLLRRSPWFWRWWMHPIGLLHTWFAWCWHRFWWLQYLFYVFLFTKDMILISRGGWAWWI